MAKFRQLHAQDAPTGDCVTGWARALAALGRTDEALAKFAEAEKIDPVERAQLPPLGSSLAASARGARARATR